MYKFHSEVIGVFFLTLAVGLSTNFLAIGFILAALIYVGSDYSGSHYNPAVSLAVWISEEISTNQFIKYLAAQFLGAVLGTLFVWWLAGTTFASQPSQSTGMAEFIAVEIFFSLLFVLVFLFMMYPNRKRKNPVYGLVIGLVFAACYIVTDPISGAGLNPALSAGFILMDTINHGYSYYNTAIYLLAPLIGGLGAAFLYKKLFILPVK